MLYIFLFFIRSFPDSKVHGDKMGPIWGPQDRDGPHAGPMNLAIWDYFVINVYCGCGEQLVLYIYQTKTKQSKLCKFY